MRTRRGGRKPRPVPEAASREACRVARFREDRELKLGKLGLGRVVVFEDLRLELLQAAVDEHLRDALEE
jgi:hypothetical protein